MPLKTLKTHNWLRFRVFGLLQIYSLCNHNVCTFHGVHIGTKDYVSEKNIIGQIELTVEYLKL